MAAATSRTQIGVQSVPVVIVAAKSADGTLTLRVEYLGGAVDTQMSQSAMVALGNSIVAVANA